MSITNICIMSMMFVLVGCTTGRNTTENAQKISLEILSGFANDEHLSNESRFCKRVEILFAETIDEEFSEEEKTDLVSLLKDPSVQCFLYSDNDLDEKIFIDAIEKIQSANTGALWRLFSSEFLALFKRKIDVEYNGVMTFINEYVSD